MNALEWAAIAAFGWGTADFLAKLSADRLGATATLFWAQVLGAVGLGVGMLALGAWPTVPWTWGAIAFALGLANTLSILWLYMSFERGMLSVVSPIAASYPVVAVLVGVFFRAERASGLQALGIALVILGTIGATWARSAPGAATRSTAGVGEALGASVGMGLTMSGMAWVVGPLGALATTMILRLSAVTSLGAWAVCRPRWWARPHGAQWAGVVGIAGLDVLAFYAFQRALLAGPVGIAAPVSGVLSLVTLIWARVFLKEHLQAHQKLAVLAVLLGVALVSA